MSIHWKALEDCDSTTFGGKSIFRIFGKETPRVKSHSHSDLLWNKTN
jgi:hypothetical protein